jgi:phosphohistidine phosphatase SixA
VKSHLRLGNFPVLLRIEARMMKFRNVFTTVFLLIFSLSAFASDDQGTIFIIRHAEKLSTDPNALLSPAGHARANCLAHLLGEANIQTVFTSNIRRTHQTASPLAKARHLTIQTIPKDNPDELVQKAKAAAQNGDVLIVGHQETVADIVQRLGGGTVPRVGPNEFDRLTVLHLTTSGATVTILRYCDCGAPAGVSQGMDQGMSAPAATAPH